MVSSRPEPHLKDLLSQKDFQAANQCIVLSVDEAGSQQVEMQTPNNPSAPTPQHLIDLLSAVLQTRQKRGALENLKGGDAQLLVDFLYSVLLGPASPGFKHQSRVLVTLYRLSKMSALHPQHYVLKDVVLDQRPVAVDSGGFCDVYREYYGGQYLCLRVLRVYDGGEEKFLRRYSKETILWGQTEHPNILPFYGICYLGNESFKQICLVSPWMENGNIVTYLATHDSVPRRPLVCDVACGLKYLHDNHIVHGDLKGANILVNSAGRACLADFGLASIQADKMFSSRATTTASVGCTYRWAAPELVEEDTPRLTKASDVWAVGCVFYEIFTGLLPFNECSGNAQIIRKLMRGNWPAVLDVVRWTDLDESMRDLIYGCWAEGPGGRPTCQQIVQELGADRPSSEDGGNGVRDQFAREKQRFRDAMRKNSDIQIDLARVEQILSGVCTVTSRIFASCRIRLMFY
ncbi:kinase-like protein [Macrolepiota fuliginosa MF-IS2]|uniref:Kinase-like protein n=1 Tax=Macrolepiota fuliginosa MF-IS2 TaxID=1400762 RepID=A0A9P5X8S0_9AGAR|nr:kinase-like protein [Macrolepiota fuliginosa MF-IS2]